MIEVCVSCDNLRLRVKWDVIFIVINKKENQKRCGPMQCNGERRAKDGWSSLIEELNGNQMGKTLDHLISNHAKSLVLGTIFAQPPIASILSLPLRQVFILIFTFGSEKQYRERERERDRGYVGPPHTLPIRRLVETLLKKPGNNSYLGMTSWDSNPHRDF